MNENKSVAVLEGEIELFSQNVFAFLYLKVKIFKAW